jgi:ferrous iron transport protein A
VGDSVEVRKLAELPPGRRCIVRTLKGGRDFMGRMAALGFTTGAVVVVDRNHGHGPLIVSVKDAPVALGRGEAQKVIVEEAADDTVTGHRLPDR